MMSYMLTFVTCVLAPDRCHMQVKYHQDYDTVPYTLTPETEFGLTIVSHNSTHENKNMMLEKQAFQNCSCHLQAIQTDGLVGLIGSNRVWLALAFALTSFGKHGKIIKIGEFVV